MKNSFPGLIIFLFLGLSVKAQPLKNTHWLLVSIDNLESGLSMPMGKKNVIKLDFDTESDFSGSACEHYDGRYKAGVEGSLKMLVVVSSKMPCMGVGKLERDLLAYYGKAERYRLKDDKLFIFTSDHRLSFKKD